jgi:hypothetical protein
MLTVVTAVRLETQAVRTAVPAAAVVEGGIGLSRLRRPLRGDAAVACGLAGGLRPDLPTGSVVIAERVLLPDGTWRTCDAALVKALAAAAHRAGIDAVRGPIATAAGIVAGAERRRLAERGCLAADMETGLLAVPRIAAVRAVLDTPDREISPAWRHPMFALLRPGLWPQAAWLLRAAPACAARAAAVVGAAIPGLYAPPALCPRPAPRAQGGTESTAIPR